MVSGFKELVQHTCNQEVKSTNKAGAFHIKVARRAKALKKWNKERIQLLRRESKEAQELILKLDQEQDIRPLTTAEIQDRKAAKNRILGLAAVRKIQIRQRSRLIWIKTSDANTELFHLRANARLRKNFIPVLHHGDTICTTQQAKH
jgi:hypothetical protein